MTLRIGTNAEFAALRGSLDRLGYSEPAVCSRLGLARLAAFEVEGPIHQQREPEDALGLLIWLLMEGQSISEQSAAKLPVAELDNLGLLRRHSARISATAMLYPVRDLFIASDRTRAPEDDASPPPAEFVYPAIVATTERYLATLRFGACNAFLDLCSGTGIAGLVAARSGARHAWAFDVTQRSTHFAEFNQRLNGIRNFTPRCGDLYEPAADLTFDCIAAHPPYVPVFRPNMIFDSGGQDGEQIVRGVIQGLPRHLRPGGRFYAPLVGTDREKPFEARLRDWLTPNAAEFDVAFFTDLTLQPGAYIAEAVTRNRAGVADVKPWRALLDELGVQAIQRGFLMIQRRARPRPVFTVRREMKGTSGPAEQHWLMDLESAAAENPAAMLDQMPRAAQSARLRVQHSLAGGGWTPESFDLHVVHPFEMRISAEAWTAQLLACADGTRTGAALLEKLKADGVLHPDTPPLEFAHVIAQLASGGFLELPGFKVPAEE